MKKVIIGLAAIGGIIALWSVAGRGAQKMREHCMQMAGKCRQMMAGQSGEHSEMREHCEETMASPKGQAEPSEPLEHSEPDAPQFLAKGEAVAV
jgi:hypothetical protein